MKQREFIKQYEAIIKFANDTFYRGCYSGEDSKKSRANFYKLKKNLDFVLKDNIENSHIRFENLELSYNLLLELYQMKSFTYNDISISFAIMICLNTDEKGEFTSTEITEKIFTNLLNNVEQKTVERKLNELLKNGYIKSCRKGNKKLYFKKHNFFDDFSKDELYLLADMTEFHINITAPSLCGYYLLQQIKRKLHEKFDTEYESIFLVKHLHLGQIFHDELVWQLIDFMDSREIIDVTLINGNTSNQIFPYKIITDESSGRRYLFGINLYKNDKSAALFRLDRICSVKSSDSEYNVSEEECNNIFTDSLSHSFTGSTLKLSGLKRVVLSFEAEFEPLVISNFPDAVISKTNSVFTAEVYVNNVNELKPYLRKFIGRIKVCDGDDDIALQMEEEMQQWREMYGLD